MALSNFSQDILRVLDEASRALAPEEIAAILTQDRDTRVLTGRVRPYLEHSLDDHIEQVSPGKWDIASPHHGRFSSSKKPVSTDRDSETDGVEDSESGVEESEVSELILEVLSEADDSLKADQIAERIRDREGSAEGTECLEIWINRKLQIDLSSRVERDDAFKWSIITNPRVEANGQTDEQEAGQQENAAYLRSRYAENDGGKYQGPEDLDENEFLRALNEIDNRIQGLVSAKTARDGDPVEVVLSQVDCELAEEHTDQVRNGNPGVKPEKAIELVREATDEVNHPVEKKSGFEEDSEQKSEEQKDNDSGIDPESLSLFQKEILEVLDEEHGHLSIEELLKVLEKKRERDASFDEVLNQLRMDLSEFVKRKSKGWTIRQAYSGRYSVDRDPSQESGTSESTSGDDKENTTGEEANFDQLSRQIFQVLNASSTALKAKEIAEEIHEGAGSALFGRVNDTKRAINQRLYGELSTFVEQDDDHRWRIELQDESVRRAIDGNVSDIGEKSASELVKQVMEEPSSAEKSTPTGISGRINERLELAKQISFLLDLNSDPLTASEITSIITSRGWEITEESVERCLKSTLGSHVKKREEGYSLQKVDGDESVSPENTPSSEMDGRESGDRPVDEVTRASISGRRYSYEFKKEDLDTNSLFVSQIRGGTVEIKLNSSHTGFERLRHVLDGRGDVKLDTKEERLKELIRSLIVSWIEVEGDLTGRRKELAEEIRDDWGRALRFLLREENEQ